jgi:hypothetical protein
MGRGRQKAKHTKVARDLKYFSPETNYNALEKELAGGSSSIDPQLEDDLAAWPEYAGAAYADDDEDEDVAENRTA